MNEDYYKVSISRENWRVFATVIASVLLLINVLILTKLAYSDGYTDAIHVINNSGYEVTHVTNVNTNYYVVNKKIEK